MFVVRFLEHLVKATPAAATEARTCYTLPTIKVTLDWLHSNRELLAHPAVSGTVRSAGHT